MKAVQDFSALVAGCVTTLFISNPQGFWQALGLGLLLAAGGWWLCARHAHL